MIASLPMYDRPQTRAAWDAFWGLVAADLRLDATKHNQEIPTHLTWDAGDADHWLCPDLVLSQTCSLPYRTRLHGKVALLGAFDFGLPGCPPGYYNSVLVMREGDPRRSPENWPNLTLAYNAPDSQSGWAAPYFHLQGLGFGFAKGIETGAHHASAQAVAEGRANIAAIDAQTHRLLRRYAPFMARLVDVARTEPTPSLPLITRMGWDADALWSALNRAVDALPDAQRIKLDLKGLVAISPEHYTALPSPPTPTEAFDT